ncbi:hypothetical protein XELAEV_18025850mg [Xenopus laevis]|uniref:Heart- and neural crest derivatives-expressed protein 1 n=1 Tax=Xenopus laevis TaxID=8355 RepID=A0A974HM78_XENLA|nr:hypothetical protein XELAEV_18025850mg [Xenopus laevis]
MNLIVSYHHHHMMPDPFIFSPGSRCWEVSPDFPAQPPYSPEYGVVVGPSQTPGRMENLGEKLGRRKGAFPKRERRRTESINSALAKLRECIPNVPADTKRSKIKTLRLATSYIGYLMDFKGNIGGLGPVKQSQVANGHPGGQHC